MSEDKPKTLMKCGHAHANVSLTVKANGDTSATGISTCGRVWECAYCAESKQMLRRASLRASLTKWLSSGRAVIHVTVTVPHRRSDDLAMVLNLLERARTKMLSGGARARLLAPHGVLAVDWTLEVTFNESDGWHPHLHMLFYLDKEVDGAGLDRLHADVAEAWFKAVRRSAERPVRPSRRAVHMRLVDDADRAAAYVTKMPCSEKGAEQGGFGLLAEYGTHLDANECSQSAMCGRCRRLVALWREYTSTMQSKNRYYAPTTTLVQPKVPRTRPPRAETPRSIITMKREAWWMASRWETQDCLYAAARTDGLVGVRSVLAGLLVLEGHTPGNAVAQARAWVWEGTEVQPNRWRLFRSWVAQFWKPGRVAARPGPLSPVPT